MSNIPAELRYSEDHEWISTSAPWKIGVSDYAQNALGDLTYVELPSVGDTFEKGQEFGTLESTKSVSPLFMPVAGTIKAVNEALVDAPEKSESGSLRRRLAHRNRIRRGRERTAGCRGIQGASETL